MHLAWERAYRLIAFVITDWTPDAPPAHTTRRPVRVLHGEHAMIES